MTFCVFLDPGKIVDMFNGDQWPGYIVSLANGFQALAFGGKTCNNMKVTNGWCDPCELVAIVVGFT